MKVAVLTAGRSGSSSLYHACKSVRNYTAGHDSGEGLLAAKRCILRDGHIEIDTRFAWFLGRLGEQDTGDCFFVHLVRDSNAVAQSYDRRWINPKSIMRGYAEGILQRYKVASDQSIALDLVETVDANIRVFLKDRRHCVIRMEHWQDDLPAFFNAIGANVDMDAAFAAFARRHNASGKTSALVNARFSLSLFIDTLERKAKALRR